MSLGFAHFLDFFFTTTTPRPPLLELDKNPFKASGRSQLEEMLAPAPPGALTSAFCVLYMRCACSDEYKDLASKEASSNPDPAVINAAAKEIEASYIEHLTLCQSLEEATTAKLDALLAAANKLGEAVDKGVGSVAAAVAGGEPYRKKRKRKEGEGEEESSEEEVGGEDFRA
ncbi:hypothetical protein V496_00170 [Pseudogymnoascus sp. VKM F-4515 (FW-2607)]|nr:hypothetical protein V496_00170 [Pseudogymnoascus sp. VKM F-4515 (FW-2607)]